MGTEKPPPSHSYFKISFFFFIFKEVQPITLYIILLIVYYQLSVVGNHDLIYLYAAIIGLSNIST